MAEVAALGAFAVSGGGAGGTGSGGGMGFVGSSAGTDGVAGVFVGSSSARVPCAEAIPIASRPVDTATRYELSDPTVCILRIHPAPSRVETELTPEICVDPSMNLTPSLSDSPNPVRRGTRIGVQNLVSARLAADLIGFDGKAGLVALASRRLLGMAYGLQ